jgi:protein O-mannosyl-transferase
LKIKKKNTNEIPVSISKQNRIIYLFFLVFVPAILYFRIINFNYTNFDDSSFITDNYNLIGNIENIPKAFVTDAYFSHKSNFYRPLQTISFMIDAQISGQNLSAYHITNLILFILIVITLFVLLQKLGVKREIGLLLALLYSVHPLLTSAVCWIPSRGDLFLTLFGLLSSVSFIVYFQTRKTKYIVFHSLFFILSCFGKETALVFPFLFTTYFYLILRKERPWNEMISFLIIWGSSFLIYFFFRNIAITANISPSLSGIVPLIKNLPVIPITFGKIFLPFNLSTMPLFDNWAIIAGVIIFVFLLVIGVVYKIYKNLYIVFSALWFISFTLPPMYVRLQNAEIIGEYWENRTLLPMIGIFIMLGIFLNIIFNKWSSLGIIKIFIPIILLFAIIAYNHSNDYSEPIAFFSSAIASNSNNATAFNSRGGEYLQNGNMKQSLADFESAIKSYPNLSNPYFNVGGIYHASGDEIKAEYYYSQALKLDTLYRNINNMGVKAYFQLSAIKFNLKKFDEVIILLKNALTLSPANSEYYNNLGFTYYTISKYDSAIYAFTKAIEFQPDNASYYTNRGLMKYSIKDFKGALSDYNRVLTLDPNSAGCWFNSGNTKIKLSDFEGAISDFSIALKINPKWGDAYFLRGNAYSKVHKEKEARQDWTEARKLGFKDPVNGKK